MAQVRHQTGSIASRTPVRELEGLKLEALNSCGLCANGGGTLLDIVFSFVHADQDEKGLQITDLKLRKNRSVVGRELGKTPSGLCWMMSDDG